MPEVDKSGWNDDPRLCNCAFCEARREREDNA